MKSCYLGIDTSNYTTSIAMVSADGELICNLKCLLPVKEGECGLRQSDAVFAHIKNWPGLLDKIQSYTKEYQILGIGVSTRPRNQEGSYMPCFLAGFSFAKELSTFLNVPLCEFSHQCGHIMAAIYSSSAFQILNAPFAAFHVSGGTTELVYGTYDKNTGFHLDVIGGSKDLHAGQLIDRTGVMLGLSFPCGPKLEELAAKNTDKIPKRKVKLDNNYVHLSGVENLTQKLYQDTNSKELTAAFVFDYIKNSLIAMTQSLQNQYGELPIVFSGGVMSSYIIQNALKTLFQAYFAVPALSSDNAVGIAVLTKLKLN